MPAVSGKIIWPRPVTPVVPRQIAAVNKPAQRSFSEILRQELKESDISFSSHAIDRMRQRNIMLQPESINRLSDAVDKAANKGSREALVLDSDLAYVVSVKNRSVITVMDRNQMRDHVFTNIDSAVLM